MTECGYGVAGDARLSGSDRANFPTLCETCLGDNPYVRMIREDSGKECKICERPYTLFRWKPGPKARFKQTIICPTCAKLKNVCQTCLFDLEYGLPVQVRDKILEESAAKVELPESTANRMYATSRLESMAGASASSAGLPYGKISDAAHERLKRMARTGPYYRRNQPRVCSFWERGECSRGAECPYAHEEPKHDPSLADQNIKDRYPRLAGRALRRPRRARGKRGRWAEKKAVPSSRW
eukprot:GHVT01070077.1.p1 GENE.GHVT01070077.1~~GHVT01070077.1.p1  ORF type:complete len:239 (+),score=48.94 GHVT01070077.1:431-1147(+)